LVQRLIEGSTAADADDWVTDDSLNLLMHLIVDQTPDGNLSDFHIVDTQLIQVGKPLPPFFKHKSATCRAVLAPLHFKNHWALAMIDLDMDVVFFYDLLPNGRDVRAEEAKRLCYWVDPRGEGFDFVLLVSFASGSLHFS
jgi:hypothetical protein